MTIDVGPVEYATTTDGVSIGYQAFGSGPAVLRLPTESVSLRLLSELPTHQSTTALAEVVKLVTYDPRGIGVSDRSARDQSLTAWVTDAAAVAEAIEPPVAVLASQMQVPAAVRLAAERPDLVSALILPNAAAADNRKLAETPLVAASKALLDADWDLWKHFIARVILRLDGVAADDYVDQLEHEIGQAAVREQLTTLYSHDARQWVASLNVPTLLVETPVKAYQRAFSEGTRILSSQIRGARLIRARDTEHYVAAVREFLASDDMEATHGAFRTVMFTDLVSSTALTQRVGDDAAQEVIEVHDTAVRQALAANNGVEIKHTGDGIMAAFDSATDAARAADQINSALTNQGVRVRVGLNAGEPIERAGDLFGTAVQLAARVCDAASQDQVLATQVVRDLTAGKGLVWSAVRAIDAKGFDEPIAVYSLNLG